jgi:hypothetical protein
MSNEKIKLPNAKIITYLRYRRFFRCWRRDVRRDIEAEKQLAKWQIERSGNISFIFEIIIHNNAVLSTVH